jgi:hypothetical protein
MLYIFRNNGGVQIAWNARAPRMASALDARQLDTRFSLLGWIRSSNAG